TVGGGVRAVRRGAVGRIYLQSLEGQRSDGRPPPRPMPTSCPSWPTAANGSCHRREGLHRRRQRERTARDDKGEPPTCLAAKWLKSFIRKVIYRWAAVLMKNPSTSRYPSRIVNRTVTPRRPPNADLREREYLTSKEVHHLQDAARKHSRYGHRDATAILIAYRHGLRASELVALTWNMLERNGGRIHVRRAKNGVDSTHPLTGKEIRALRQLRRENLRSRYVFNTERGGPVTRAWFLKMVR